MSEEADYEDVDEGVPSFLLGLSEAGEGEFRTQNDPNAPLQRRNITERAGTIDIRCKGVDVIHGHLKDGAGPATLVVYDFQFDTRKKGRRIVSIDISFLFKPSSGSSGADPAVIKIAPQGRKTLVPTTQTEETTKGGNVKAGGNVMGAEIGGSWKWEKTINRETKDATRIVGSIDLVNRNYGDSNAASWTLLENESARTGVPAHFRTAVLLQRPDEDSEFESTFKIGASVDLVSKFTKLFGATPKDDPILYDPGLPPTHKLRTYDVANLDAVDLEELSAVSFTNYD